MVLLGIFSSLTFGRCMIDLFSFRVRLGGDVIWPVVFVLLKLAPWLVSYDEKCGAKSAKP